MTLDSERYGSARTLCEFMTGMACVMETSGALTEGMSDQLDEFMEPVRLARDWLRLAGRLMVESKPLPQGFELALDAAAAQALCALPAFKCFITQTCDALAEAQTGEVAARAAAERRAAACNAPSGRPALGVSSAFRPRPQGW